jgi:hypothetical protein
MKARAILPVNFGESVLIGTLKNPFQMGILIGKFTMHAIAVGVACNGSDSCLFRAAIQDAICFCYCGHWLPWCKKTLWNDMRALFVVVAICERTAVFILVEFISRMTAGVFIRKIA